ncbi:MAG: hypothetical protein DRP89_03930 [Candidatus Neomarinimicrobiota bacterium]|nr:MAG: hypothetical protein DRP89_03930 [Candidatus Neomarinimicrobiota bacterium]
MRKGTKMNQPRKHHSAVKKIEIPRVHLEIHVPISKLSRRFGLNLNLIHKCSTGVPEREKAII